MQKEEKAETDEQRQTGRVIRVTREVKRNHIVSSQLIQMGHSNEQCAGAIGAPSGSSARRIGSISLLHGIPART